MKKFSIGYVRKLREAEKFHDARQGIYRGKTNFFEL